MEAYFDVSEPGSYGGVQALYRLLREKNVKITLKQVREWLAEQDSYSLHKPVRRRFQRRRIYARTIDYLWQTDIVDMIHLAEYNDGYRYLLTVIDVFSKYAWVVPLKKKDAISVAAAVADIFAKGRKPLKLMSDKGTEYTNNTLQRKLREERVQFFTSQNEDIKASVAERFNRTLKTKMWRYFTHRNTNRYIDVLQDFVHSYNHSYHRTIGRTPASVKHEDVDEIRTRMYGDDAAAAPPPSKLKVNDKVRISKTRRVFDKGYRANWTGEIFTVVEVIRTTPTTYKIADYGGEIIEGSFYDYELQAVIKNDDVYKIDKILRTRRKNGAKEYFVKWKDYPDKFNSWVGESDLVGAI